MQQSNKFNVSRAKDGIEGRVIFTCLVNIKIIQSRGDDGTNSPEGRAQKFENGGPFC